MQTERDQLRWYQRTQRNDLDVILDGHTRAHVHWSERVGELQEQLASRPETPEPPDLWRAADPLSASDVGIDPDLAVPAPDLAPDIGFGLGP